MLVYLHRNYDFPDLFRQTPGNSGKWGEFEFTENRIDECDAVVVLNNPKEDISIRCRKGARMLIIQEPPYPKNDYFKEHFRHFDLIISGFKPENKNFIMLDEPAMLPWHIDLSYDELKKMRKNDLGFKQDKISWVTSNSNMNPGHEPRLKFLRNLRDQQFDIDLFGRGINPLKDKSEGVLPYKYTLAVENYSGKDYWTEKIADAFLSWTMPVYYGCTNIDKYFPAGSYIAIDINKPEEAMRTIRKAMEEKAFERNIGALEEARNLVLEKYQFFPRVTALMEKNFDLSGKKVDYTIPYRSSSKLEKILDKMKSIISSK